MPKYDEFDIDSVLATQEVFGQGDPQRARMSAALDSAIGKMPDNGDASGYEDSRRQQMSDRMDAAIQNMDKPSYADIDASQYTPDMFSSYQGFRESMDVAQKMGLGGNPHIEAERESIQGARDEQREKINDRYSVGSLNPYRLVPGYVTEMEKQRKQQLGEWTTADAQEYAASQARRGGLIEGLGDDFGGTITKNLVAGGTQMALGGMLPGFDAETYRGAISPQEQEEIGKFGGMGNTVMELGGAAVPYILGGSVAGIGAKALAARTGLGAVSKALPAVGYLGRTTVPIGATQAALSSLDPNEKSAGDILAETSTAMLIGAAIPAARPLTAKATGALGKVLPKVGGKPVFGSASTTTSRAANGIEFRTYGEAVQKLSGAVRAQYQKGVLDFARYPIESIAEGVIATAMVGLPQVFSGSKDTDDFQRELIAGGLVDMVLSMALRGSPFEHSMRGDLDRMLVGEPMRKILHGAKQQAKHLANQRGIEDIATPSSDPGALAFAESRSTQAKFDKIVIKSPLVKKKDILLHLGEPGKPPEKYNADGDEISGDATQELLRQIDEDVYRQSNDTNVAHPTYMGRVPHGEDLKQAVADEAQIRGVEPSHMRVIAEQRLGASHPKRAEEARLGDVNTMHAPEGAGDRLVQEARERRIAAKKRHGQVTSKAPELPALPARGAERRITDGPVPGGKERRTGDRRRTAERLRKQRGMTKEAVERSYRDELTGVLNRSAFERDRAAVESNPDKGYVSVDATSLGVMNDYGSPATGDRLLQMGAKRLEKIAQDLGVKNFKVYRPGGDEFFMSGSKADMQRVAEVVSNYRGDDTFLMRMESPKIGKAESRIVGGYGDTKDIADESLNKVKKEYKSDAVRRGQFIQKKASSFDADAIIKSLRKPLGKVSKETRAAVSKAYVEHARATKSGDEARIDKAEAKMKGLAASVLKEAGVKVKKEEPAKIFEEPAKPKAGKPKNPKPGARIGERGMALNPVDLLLPNKAELQAIGENIVHGLKMSGHLLRRGVHEMVVYPISATSKMILPSHMYDSFKDAKAIRKSIDTVLGARDIDTAKFPDAKSAAIFFQLMANKNWQDAGWFARTQDPIKVLGEPVVLGFERMIKGISSDARRFAERLYRPDGAVAKMQRHYGLVHKKVKATKKSGDFKDGDTKGYRESWRKIGQALEHDLLLRKKGVDWLKDRKWAKPSDLNKVEAEAFDAVRSIYTDFRRMYAEHYGKAPDQWGFEDYMNHFWSKDSGKDNAEYLQKGSQKADVPVSRFAEHTLQREKWSEDWVQDAEIAITRYIPAALTKIHYERAMRKIVPIVHGRVRTTSGEKVLADAEAGVILQEKATMTGLGGSGMQIKRWDADKGKWGEYETVKYTDFSKKDGTITVEFSNGKTEVYNKRNMTPQAAPKGSAAQKREFHKQNKSVRVRYHQHYVDPKSGQIYGMMQLFRMKGNENRMKYMRQYISDMTTPFDATRIERMAEKLVTFHHMQFLGGNVKSAALNFTQTLMTVAEVGAVNTAKASAVLFAGGTIALKNGSKLDSKRANAIAREIILDDAYYAASGDTQEALLQDMATALDPKAPVTALHMASRAWMGMFSASEQIMRRQSAIAGYIRGIELGGTHKQAIAHAGEVLAKTQGVYRKHRSPQIFRRQAAKGMVEGAVGKAARKSDAGWNTAKALGLIFQRFSVMAASAGVSWGQTALHYASAKAGAKVGVPKLPNGGQAPIPPPNSKEFAALSRTMQSIYEAQWKALTPKERRGQEIYAKQAERFQRDQNRVRDLGEASQYNNPAALLKFAVMAGVIAEFGERALKMDWSFGSIFTLPGMRGIESTMADGYRGFVEGFSSPAVQTGLRAGGLVSVIMSAKNADAALEAAGKEPLGIMNYPAVQNAMYDFMKRSVAPTVANIPIDSAFGLVEELKPGDKGYDPSKTIAKKKGPGSGNPSLYSKSDLIRSLILPGRPLNMKAVDEAYQEMKTQEETNRFMSDAQTAIFQNAAKFYENGEVEKAKAELQKVQDFAAAMGTEFTKSRASNILKSSQVGGLARKVLQGSVSDRWKSLDIALKKSEEHGVEVLSQKEARYIMSQLLKPASLKRLRYMPKGTVLKVMGRYEDFMRIKP